MTKESRPYQRIETDKLKEMREQYLGLIVPRTTWMTHVKTAFYFVGLILLFGGGLLILEGGLKWDNSIFVALGGTIMWRWRVEEQSREFYKRELELISDELWRRA